MNINAKAHSIYLPLLTRAQAKGIWGQTKATREEFIRFFRVPGPRIPYIIKVHVVLDNLKMHKGKRYKHG